MGILGYLGIGFAVLFVLFLFGPWINEHSEKAFNRFFPPAVLIAAVAGVFEFWANQQRGFALCFGAVIGLLILIEGRLAELKQIDSRRRTHEIAVSLMAHNHLFSDRALQECKMSLFQCKTERR